MRTARERAVRRIAAVATMTVGLALLTGSPGQAKPETLPEQSQAKAAQTIYSTGFDDLTGWLVVEAERIGPVGKSQAYYRNFNVATTGGVLQVVTRRHCVRKGTAVAVNNASEGVCKKGKKTRYSSGRVQADLPTPAGSNFEAEFSALMPATGVKGGRAALWLNNTTSGQAYCTNGKQKIVELDTLEWMSKGPAKSLHTTHIGCNPKPGKRAETQRKLTVHKFDRASWYQWKVRRVGNTITYWRTPGGGAPVKVASHTCGKGKFANLSKKRCAKLLANPNWLAIINGEVFANKTRKPNNSARFPTQVLTVDWFELRLLK